MLLLIELISLGRGKKYKLHMLANMRQQVPKYPKIPLSSAGAWPFLQSSQLKALNNKCRYRMLCARAQGAQGYHAPLSAVLLQAYTTEAATQFIDKVWMNP